MKIILVPIFSNHVQSLMECDSMNVIPKIDPILNITREERGEESLETYIHIRLKHCESELSNLTKKYGVS